MGTSIITMLSNAFSAVAAWFGYRKQRDAEQNTPAMQMAAAQREQQKIVDRATKAVTNHDEEEIKREIAE